MTVLKIVIMYFISIRYDIEKRSGGHLRPFEKRENKKAVQVFCSNGSDFLYFLKLFLSLAGGSLLWFVVRECFP